MPQVQFLDMPNWGSALGKFGSGLIEGATESYKRQGEDDALEKMLKQFKPDMSEEEKIRLIYGSKGIPFEQKKQVAKSVSDIMKKSKTFKDDELKSIKNDEMKNTLIENGTPEWLADLYVGATDGGKTAIMNHLLDENPELFQKMNPIVSGSVSGEQPDEIFNIGKTNEQASQEEKLDLSQFDKGLTRKEKVKREDDRFKLQVPKLQDNSKELRALDADQRDIDELLYLNDKMAEVDTNWLREANIVQFGANAGDIIFPKAATPEQTQWQKIIYAFQKRAKDSYGARVTNFDIANFMKRFPTLAHSPEARRMILKQMQLVNEIDRTYKKELDQVFKQVGGVRKIDWDEAERIARSRAGKKVTNIDKEFKAIERGVKKTENRVIEEKKKEVPVGRILVQDPDGKFFNTSPEKARQLKKETGWRVHD